MIGDSMQENDPCSSELRVCIRDAGCRSMLSVISIANDDFCGHYVAYDARQMTVRWKGLRTDEAPMV